MFKQFFAIFTTLLLSVFLQVNSAAPPKTPPNELLDDYSLNSTIPIEYFYVDDTSGDGNFTHYKYSEKSIEAMIVAASKSLKKYESLYSNMMQKRQDSNDDALSLSKNELETDVLSKLFLIVPKSEWLQVALSIKQFKYSKFAIRNKVVAVIGSSEPWIEALMLALNASQVYTLEYNQLSLGHKKITTITGHDLLAFYNTYDNEIINKCISQSSTNQNTCTNSGSSVSSPPPLFDTVIAISSLDHDGLGRYGDPLNPNGDLESMTKISQMVKPGGYMFITMPIGSDMVVFNLLRRYGPVRFPKLIEAASGFTVIDKLGWEEARFTDTPDFRHSYEPVIILKKTEFSSNTAEQTDVDTSNYHQ